MRPREPLGLFGTLMSLAWVLIILLFCIGPMTILGAWAGCRAVLFETLKAANKILDRTPSE